MLISHSVTEWAIAASNQLPEAKCAEFLSLGHLSLTPFLVPQPMGYLYCLQSHLYCEAASHYLAGSVRRNLWGDKGHQVSSPTKVGRKAVFAKATSHH